MEHPVTIVTATPTPIAVVRETTTWEAFPNRWRVLLDEVWALVRSSGLTAGRNVMVYADDTPNVEIGVEMPEAFRSSGRVVPSTLPSGRAARTVARVRRGKRPGRSLPDPPRATFAAEAVTLFRSHLGGGPARYEALERVPLSSQ